ncbi:protein MIZU-KUSSEI 1 [Syzygium oleosum]|uniref:protein MIZU-KUSSEI 1 n=1 Tax=Syzygium oleosum TaxID=219896 RepID=UPI0011D23E6E|nr:protein MIZU-KUSSEI 1 [Syzygium oleosum]
MRSQELALQRSTTSSGSYRSARRITPSSSFPRPCTPSSPTPPPSRSHHEDMAASAPSDNKLLLRKSSSRSSAATTHHRYIKISSLLRSFLSLISSFQLQSLIPAPAAACRFLSLPRHLSLSSSSSSSTSLGRKVTGTLFGQRRGHVSFAVQDGPQSDPVLLLELAISTSALVKEMSSGLVRIALECEKTASTAADRPPRLFQEPAWTMYCNGRKCGYAASRTCTESDLHVLRTVRTMSVGAGVIPVLADDGQKASGGGDGELLYMRARFERVVGSRDSEAFYMLNPDGNGGPELSIFLLRL